MSSMITQFRMVLMAAVFAIALPVVGQIGLCPMSEIQPSRVTTADLDSMYTTVFDRSVNFVAGADSTLTKDAVAVNGWANLSAALNGFFSDHNFVWNHPTRIFCRFYFNPSGGIEYVLTEIKTAGFDRQTQLCRLLREFSKSYHFPAHSEHAFSHCGMVTFKDHVSGVGKID